MRSTPRVFQVAAMLFAVGILLRHAVIAVSVGIPTGLSKGKG